jgi:hypothetical protein
MSKLSQTYGLPGTTAAGNACKSLVRMGRLELPRPCGRWNLNPVRLPIPPHPRLYQRNIADCDFEVGLVSRKLRNSCGFRVNCGNVAITFCSGSRIA